MSERAIRIGIAALALVGAALAGYLVYVRSTGGALACASGGCETVQSSSYSKVLGIPVAALGLAAYLAVFVTAIVPGDLARTAGVSIALAGVGFSAYLIYVQVSLIGAICDWCVGSDAVMTALAMLTLLRVLAARPTSLDPWPET